jgi:hypothetical protein
MIDRCLDVEKRVSRAFEQRRTFLRQGKGAVLAREQSVTQPVFQMSNVLTNRPLRQAQLSRRFGKTEQASCHFEAAQAAQQC